MTQEEIICQCWEQFNKDFQPNLYSSDFHFLCGVLYALQYAHRQFLELMEEWYGDKDFQEEREEMTRLFEERIGIEE